MDYDIALLDKNAFLFLNGKHNAFFDVLMYGISSMLLWIPLSIFISYVLIKNFHVESKGRLVLNIFLIFILAAFQFVICMHIMPSFLENIVHRIRPCYDPEISTFVHYIGNDCGDKFGFFAPRSCFAFSMATFLCFSLKDGGKALKFLFLLWAILISYSRIYLGHHFPGNVIVSGILGAIIGFLLFRSFFYVKNSVLSI